MTGVVAPSIDVWSFGWFVLEVNTHCSNRCAMLLYSSRFAGSDRKAYTRS